jgi:phage-related protein
MFQNQNYDKYVINRVLELREVFEIEYFQTVNGHKPVKEFIDDQDVKMQAKIFRQLQLLKEFGPKLGEPFSSMVAKGIFEMRIQQSNNITRIFHFFVRNQRIVLTHGFTKKTQKTPYFEISRAIKYRAEYESR